MKTTVNVDTNAGETMLFAELEEETWFYDPDGFLCVKVGSNGYIQILNSEGETCSEWWTEDELDPDLYGMPCRRVDHVSITVTM